MALQRDDLAYRYPTRDHLRDGTTVVFRQIASSDRDALIGFARALQEEDLLYLREDITSPPVVDQWLADVERGETFTVLAEVGDGIAGYGSLHMEPARWTRHVGEIRINVHPDYRGTGLGGLLAGEVRAAAPAFSVRILSAQMPVDQLTARKVFDRLGFRYQAVLPGWVMDRDGRDLDLLVMACEL